MKLTTLLPTVVALLLPNAGTFGALPDLLPISIQVPPAVTNTPNPSVTISWTVTNQGGSAAGGYSDGIYISTNANFDSNDYILGTWFVPGPVAPGASYSNTNTFRLPIGFSGTYYLLFKADVFNVLSESNENNNVIVTPLKFESTPPDLAPLSAQLPKVLTGPPNPNLTFVWAVTNRGPGAALGAWGDSIYLSNDPVWTPNASSLGFFLNQGPVPAGQVYWQTNIASVPVVTSGNYYLIFKTDIDNTLYESNVTNNVLSVPVSFNIQPPDLAPFSVQVASEITSLANPYLNIVWGTTNLGPSAAVGFWTDQIFFSTNAVLDESSDPVVATSYEYGPIPAGGRYWHTNLVQLPVLHSGTYYLIFKTDVQNTLFESEVSNNVTVLPVAFTILQPDLAPISFQAPTVVTSPPNPTLTLSWGVTNQGTGLTTGAWADQVYLSLDAVLDPADVYLFSDYEYYFIDTGEDYWRTNDVRVPVTQSGTYYLIFKTDDGDALHESNTNNNTMARPVTFTIRPPNLAPVALQTPTPITAPPNPTIQIAWGITNRGSGAASGYWYDKIYFSTDAQLDASDTQLIVNSESGPIPPGGSYRGTNSAQVPVTRSGTYYIIFAANADSNSKLFESDYTDNVRVVPVTINILPPDLAPVAGRMPGTVTGPPYPTVTLVWGITNQGIGPATGSAWNDAIYFSPDPFLNPGAPPVVPTYDYGPIPPGGVLWLTNIARLPVTTSGTNYFIIQANVGNQLFESDYNNNLVTTPVRIDIRPPDLAPIALQAPTDLNGPPYPNVTVVWAVTNQGGGSAIGNWAWYDHLYISTNALWDSGAGDIFSLIEQGPVPVGDTYWRTNTVHLPVTASGTYYLFFKANASQDLIESDVNNNTASLAFTFTVQPPDLAPVSVQVPSVVTGPPYPKLTYVWGVTNRGTGTASTYPGSWIDTVALSTNDIGSQSSYQLAYNFQTGPVEAGGVYWQTNTLRVPVTQSGTYFLIFNTDTYLSLVESDYSNNIVAAPITFNIQPPDLAPVALMAPTNITGIPNPSLTLVWGVTNQGVGPVADFDSWNDAVYLSTDPVWDWQDALIATSDESGPILAGQSYWHSNTIHVPVLQSGSYYLIFKVDAGSGLVESDESNNVAVVPITFNIQPPDLAPVPPSISSTITGAPNPVFTLVWGVTNRGPGQAMGLPPWTDQVYFSRNAKLDTQDPVISSTFDPGPIDPGGVAWQTNAVFAPVVQSGNYYLIFEANSDVYNRLYESDYSNNVAVVPVSFNIQRPDLAPVTLAVPAQITTTPNPILTFVWSVTNRGTGAVTSPYSTPTWSDVLYFSTNQSLGQGEQFVIGDSPMIAVPAGGSYWRTNSVRVPVVQSGTYYFILQADDNRALYESDYNNNTLTVPVTFNILPPDLTPLALRVSSVVTSAPNPRVSVTWGVTNQGTGEAQGFWSDFLYLSTNSTLDASALQVTYSLEYGPTPAGGSYSRTNSVQLPVVQSGNYYLIFKANEGNALFESDFNNNTLAIPLTFTILKPDLAPIALKAPSQVTGPPNPSVNLAWGVTNQGAGPALPASYWADRIYLSTTPVLDQGILGPLATLNQQEELPPGGSYWGSQWVQVPVLTDGTYYLIFRADADNAIYESDESNNQLAVPVTFKIQQPDLVPIALQAPSAISSSPYPTLKLTYGVTNQGVGPASVSWKDSFYLSTDTRLDANDISITYHSEQGPLPAGSSYWRTMSITAPVTNSGKYYLLFRADSGGNLYESNTNNNLLSVPVTFAISAPDLAPIQLQAPAVLSGPPNPIVTLVWSVTNQGPGDILAGTGYWLDQVYFSTNASLDTATATTLASTFESGPVLSGGAYWRTNQVELPMAQDGTYYLFLDVNSSPYQRAVESNYSNNLAVAPITFHMSQADLAPIFLQSSVSIPAPLYPFVTVIWGVTNQGVGPTRSNATSWTVAVSISKTNETDGSLIPVRSWSWNQTNVITPGESFSSTNLIHSTIAQSGTYLLTFTVNGYGLLDDSNTNNNSATNLLPVTIVPPDIAPIFFSAPATVTGLAYPEIVLAWGVTNRGLGAELPDYFYWFDRVYLSTNSFLDSSAVVVDNWLQADAIPPGGSYWRTNITTLPIQKSGTYYLILQLDALNVLQEANRSNNVAVIPLSFSLPPPTDLAILQFQISTNVIGPPNPTLTFVWGVTNLGPSLAQSSRGWSDALYLSTVPVPDGTERYLGGSYETNTVAPGGVYWRTNLAVVPVTRSGTYYLVFKTDADFALAEADYGNNTSTVSVTFNITPPDLRPFALFAPAAVTNAPNPGMTIVVGVTNQGAGAAAAAGDTLYISATPTRDSSARLIASWFRTNTIAPGGSYWLTNTVRLPVGEGGLYYLLFEADTYNVLGESDALNNDLSVPIRLELSLQPDLAVEEFHFPNVVTGQANPTVKLVWHVTNQGLGPALGPWSDRVSLTGNTPFDPGSVLGVFEEKGTVLPVGMDYWRTNTVTLPLSQSDSRYLYFQANSGYDLFELDYGNNGAFVPIKFVLTPAVPVRIGASQLLGDGSIMLAILGPAGTPYTLQTSTDLFNWVRRLDFMSTNTTTWIQDRLGGDSIQRFYRVAPYAGASAHPLRLDLASGHPWNGNSLELQLDGPLSGTYRIQASSNLSVWITMTNFSSTLVSPVYFRDDSAANASPRFYRAVTP